MDDLKNQIFALLKKCPTHGYVYDCGGHIGYSSETASYDVELTEYNEEHGVYFSIHTGFNSFSKFIPLTEKEYMDIKWKIEDWQKELENKALEEFKDFVEAEPSSMDDLLND